MAKKKRTNKSFGKRRVWLNTDQNELACVAWDVHRNQYSDDKEYDSISADLVLRDCHRTVTLEFFCEVSGAAERLKKADKLLKEVQSFRDALASAMGKE